MEVQVHKVVGYGNKPHQTLKIKQTTEKRTDIFNNVSPFLIPRTKKRIKLCFIILGGKNECNHMDLK